MTTKMSHYDIRRREHGELIEFAVLDELIHSQVVTPIMQWDGLVRPKHRQPFFVSVDGSSEQPLDEFGWVTDEERAERMACIIEVKAMRANDWHEWRDYEVWHNDKNIQHAKHIQTCRVHDFGGVCVVAVNKDSSEFILRVFNRDDKIERRWDYEL